MQNQTMLTIYLPRKREAAAAVLETLARWRRNARTRAALAKLDARELADIGVDHSIRARECAKRFWRD